MIGLEVVASPLALRAVSVLLFGCKVATLPDARGLACVSEDGAGPADPVGVFMSGARVGGRRSLAVVCLIIALFRRAPPATLEVRGMVLTVVCLIIASAFPSLTFLRVFPGFVAKSFRGVGVGVEEPHLRLMF